MSSRTKIPKARTSDKSDLPFSRTRYFNLFEKYIFPEILEEHWKTNYEYRDKEKKWTEASLWVDAFIPVGKKVGESKTVNEVTNCCLIPQPLWFWDIILSLYLLKVPEHKTYSQMIRNLYTLIEKAGVNNKTYDNMTGLQWKFLDDLYKGGIHKLTFLQDPVKSLVQVKNVQFLFHVFGEKCQNDLVLSMPKIQEQMQKCTKDVCDKVLPILGLTYDEYELIYDLPGATIPITINDHRKEESQLAKTNPSGCWNPRSIAPTKEQLEKFMEEEKSFLQECAEEAELPRKTPSPEDPLDDPDLND